MVLSALHLKILFGLYIYIYICICIHIQQMIGVLAAQNNLKVKNARQAVERKIFKC